MDKPLLALTRRANVGSGDGAGVENMRQLVQLRWIAVAGQLATIMTVKLGLGVTLPMVEMLAVAGLLVLANLAAALMLRRHRVSNAELTLALLIDIGALTAQLALSGGASNPFVSFYLLQVVLGAILLEMWSAWLLVAVTGLCFAGLTAGATPLPLPARLLPARGGLYTLGALIGFVLTAMLLGLFVTRIIRNLRARDRRLADLREQAAEEDGIVRMGLFASAAAHELGTPLASLSVILGDWRRMPRLANDPELAGELGEMQAEVDRCKAIVTDILHSAGQPRGEPMENAGPCRFLADVVAAWRSAHPGVSVALTCNGLDEAALVVGASLRQALGNLLDNAAEASPAHIALDARQVDGGCVIAVNDRGPGFAEAQLALVGRPYQSSKGAGHGLGLFLAANVARRLGGRLEATNLPEGGASVRLILPLAHDRTRIA
jgi:two-component system sensor histidine kinase RegB